MFLFFSTKYPNAESKTYVFAQSSFDLIDLPYPCINLNALSIECMPTIPLFVNLSFFIYPSISAIDGLTLTTKSSSLRILAFIIISLRLERKSVHSFNIIPMILNLEEFEPSYLIDAEGAHSIIRSTLGMEFKGKTREEHYALGDLFIDADLPETDLHIFSSKYGFLGLFPMGNRRFRMVASNLRAKTARIPAGVGGIAKDLRYAVPHSDETSRAGLEFMVPYQQPDGEPVGGKPHLVGRRRRSHS